MKTFRLFSMAALALMMAACSNNEDSALENTIPAAPGTMHFTATIAAPSSGATTRTTYTEVTSGDDAGKINVKWEVGDKIALVHNGVVDEAEVKTVDDVTGKATIEANITGSPSDDDVVTLAYPADAVVSATPYSPFPFTPNPDIFDKVKKYQDGTLTYIQDNLDLRMGSGKLAVSGSDVSLKGSVSVSSLICIWKLTLQNESSNALSATKLTFKNNDDTQAKATSAAKSEYYLCVVPSFIPDPSGTFSFEATVGSDTYTFSKTGLSLTAGKYYQSTLKMAPPTVLSGALVDGAIIKVNFKWRNRDRGDYVQGVYNAASGTFTASKGGDNWGRDDRAVYKVEKSGNNIIIGAGFYDYNGESMVWTFNTTNDTYTTTNGVSVNAEPGEYGLISVTLNGTNITSQLTAK